MSNRRKPTQPDDVFDLEEPDEIAYFQFRLPGVYQVELGDDGQEHPVVDHDDNPVPLVFRVPQMGYLEVGQVSDMERGGLAEVMEAFGEANVEHVRRLNGIQMGKLMNAWRDASRINEGKSRA